MKSQARVQQPLIQGGQAAHHLFLLRIWRQAGSGPWRVALITADGQEVRYLASLLELFTCLWLLLQDDKMRG